MPSYRLNGFAFNRDNLRGVDADTLGGITRYLVAREREINTIDTVTVVCNGGPFNGQQIELQPTGSGAACSSAQITVRGWCGRYVGADWESTAESENAKVLDFVPVAKPTARIDAKGMGKGFDALRDLLAQLGEDPAERATTKTRPRSERFTHGQVDDFGNMITNPAQPGAYAVTPHSVKQGKRWVPRNIITRCGPHGAANAMDDYGNLFAVNVARVHREQTADYPETYQTAAYTIGRTTYTIPATVEACEKLAARIIAKKKWFSDKMLQAGGPVAKPATVDADARAAAQVAAGCFVADLVASAAAAVAVDNAKSGRITAPALPVHTPARELASTGAGGGHLPPTQGDYMPPRKTSDQLHEGPRDLGPQDLAPGDNFTACAFIDPVFCTEPKRIGKTLWTLCVYRHPVYGGCTGFSWFSEKACAWLRDREHPRYDGNDTHNGLPVALGKLYDAHLKSVNLYLTLNGKPSAKSAAQPAPETPAVPHAAIMAHGYQEDTRPATTPPPARPQTHGLHAGARDLKSDSMSFSPPMKPICSQITIAPRGMSWHGHKLQNDENGSIMRPPETTNMTGAELQTLREACGLSREDLADLAGVQGRTIKHWEHGRAGVPADVAALVTQVDNHINRAALEALNALTGPTPPLATEKTPCPPIDMVLMRYQTLEELARYRPDMANLKPGVHGAIVNRLRLLLAMAPGFSMVPVRVVWMQPELYEPWRAACQLPDSETTRAQWAAQQLENQARPHKPDQPPPT